MWGRFVWGRGSAPSQPSAARPRQGFGGETGALARPSENPALGPSENPALGPSENPAPGPSENPAPGPQRKSSPGGASELSPALSALGKVEEMNKVPEGRPSPHVTACGKTRIRASFGKGTTLSASKGIWLIEVPERRPQLRQCEA
jgi:hypothetical protein